jgi:hypothetical protein
VFVLIGPLVPTFFITLVSFFASLLQFGPRNWEDFFGFRQIRLSIYASYMFGFVPAVIVGVFASQLMTSNGKVSLKVTILAAAGVSVAAMLVILRREIFVPAESLAAGHLAAVFMPWLVINEVAAATCWLICLWIYRVRGRSPHADSAMTSP